MIITLKKNAPQTEVERLHQMFEDEGLQVTLIKGVDFNVFGLVGDTSHLDERDIKANIWVENVQRVSAPYKLANRMFHPEDTIVDVAGVKVGGHEKIAVIGGPCSVEGKEQICRIAQAVKEGGADMLRGGAYKPRTSPYAFQGLGYEGLMDLAAAGKMTGLPVVSEIMSADKIDEFEEYVDLVL